MTHATSPWPERRRSKALLLGAGSLLLVVVALALAGLVDLPGTAVVGAATVASGLLLYGLLGWAGQWVDESVAEPPDGSRPPDSSDSPPADADGSRPTGGGAPATPVDADERPAE